MKKEEVKGSLQKNVDDKNGRREEEKMWRSRKKRG
jgi:hypothetical protein